MLKTSKMIYNVSITCVFGIILKPVLNKLLISTLFKQMLTLVFYFSLVRTQRFDVMKVYLRT